MTEMRVGEHLKVGDKVMILRPSRKNKLEVQWDGPIKVTKKISEINYTLEVPGRRNKGIIYHCNLMKPYSGREEVVNMVVNASEEVAVELPVLATVTGVECSIEDNLNLSINRLALEANQVNDLQKLFEEFRQCFSSQPGRTTLITHEIELTSDEPVQSKPYRVSPRQQEIMEVEIKRMLELGIIEPADSDYTSPMILVEASGKEPRPCVDYRKLNAITRNQLYPIPNIEERVERVSGAEYISTIELVRGYW